MQQGIKQGAGSGESLAVRLERAAREREVGNDHYRRKAYRKAATSYNRVSCPHLLADSASS